MKKYIFAILLLLNTPILKGQVNTDHLLSVGANAIYFKDYVLSIQYFNKIIKAKPYLEKAYLYRAYAKIYLEDYVGALADLNDAIAINEFLPSAYYARGFVCNKLTKHDLAEKDFTKALEFSPDNTSYIIGRLESFDCQQKYQEELSLITKLIKKLNGDPQLTLEKGRVQLLLGDTISAFNTIDGVVRSDSSIANAWGGRAMLNMITSSPDSAISDYNKAISLQSDNFGYYINRGNLLYNKKKYREAIADYNKAIELSPNNIQALYNRSLLMTEIADYNKALTDLNKLIKRNANMDEAIYQRATIYHTMGNHTDAIADLTQIISKYPNFAPAYMLRAKSYNALRHIKARDKDMQRVMDIERQIKQNSCKNPPQSLNVGAKTVANKSKVSDWAKLFDADDSEIKNDNRFDNNKLRGTIQNIAVEVIPQKDFVISPYRKESVLENTTYFFAPLNSLNKELKNSSSLYFINDEVPLTDALIEFHFKNIGNLSDSIADKPNKADKYLFVRGINYSILQDLDNANNDFSSVIEFKPNALAYFCRAVGRKKILDVERATKINNNTTKTNIIVEGHKSTDFEMILRDYDKAIELCPDFTFAWYNRANCLTSIKDFNAAISNYSQAIEINKNFAAAYYNRGLVYIYIGETNKGIEDLSKAGELGIYSAYSLIKKLSK